MITIPDPTREDTEWPRRRPPRKVAYFEPVPRRLPRSTIIESTFEARRFRCTMRVDCGQLAIGAVIRPEPGEWHPRMPERRDEAELADWHAGRNAVYQLAALTLGARLAVADAKARSQSNLAPAGRGGIGFTPSGEFARSF